MQNEKIDILMATYNGERFLRDQIDSILNQTYSNFNLYICDDASTDKTVEILREYEIKDSRIKIFINDKNIGSNENFKKLLSLVNSKFYMFSDQDDVWNSNKIEKTYFKLIEKDADLVFTDLAIVDENLNIINESFNKKKGYKDKILKMCNTNKIVHLYNVVTGCTILSKKSFIPEILKFENNTKHILHDHIIPLVVEKNGKIEYLDESTILYRQHSSNQVGSKRYVDRFNNFLDIREHLINVKIDIFNTYQKNLDFFDDETNNLNKKALVFFNSIKNKKIINLKYLSVYHELYKYDKLLYYILYFVIMNVPILAKFVYFIKSLINKRSVNS